MSSTDIWNIFGIISVICLVISIFLDKSAIWGSFILGTSACIVIAVITYFINSHVNWSLVKDILIVFVLAGSMFELISKLTNSKKKIV